MKAPAMPAKTAAPDSPGILLPPPLIPLAMLAGGVALQRVALMRSEREASAS